MILFSRLLLFGLFLTIFSEKEYHEYLFILCPKPSVRSEINSKAGSYSLQEDNLIRHFSKNLHTEHITLSLDNVRSHYPEAQLCQAAYILPEIINVFCYHYPILDRMESKYPVCVVDPDDIVFIIHHITSLMSMNYKFYKRSSLLLFFSFSFTALIAVPVFQALSGLYIFPEK